MKLGNLFVRKMLCLTLLLGTQNVFAHGDHIVLDGEQAVVEADNRLKLLIQDEKNKLDQSWLKTVPGTFEIDDKAATDGKQKGKMKQRRLHIVYINPTIKDPTQSKLRIILTPGGKFVGHEFVTTETKK